MTNPPPLLHITELDLVRLQGLLDQMSHHDQDHGEALAEKLSQAHIVTSREIAGDIVTMNSSVVCDDLSAGATLELTLVYPEDADPQTGHVSVFSPVGSALLGRARGETVLCALPGGTAKSLRVREILFQPEARGWYEL